MCLSGALDSFIPGDRWREITPGLGGRVHLNRQVPAKLSFKLKGFFFFSLLRTDFLISENYVKTKRRLVYIYMSHNWYRWQFFFLIKASETNYAGNSIHCGLAGQRTGPSQSPMAPQGPRRKKKHLRPNMTQVWEYPHLWQLVFSLKYNVLCLFEAGDLLPFGSLLDHRVSFLWWFEFFHCSVNLHIASCFILFVLWCLQDCGFRFNFMRVTL